MVADLPAAGADVRQLHSLMVGRGLQAEYYREPLQKPHRDEVVLRAEGLGRTGHYRDVSFDLHAGEILGIAGVIGSGREELTRTLAGFLPHDAGKLTVFGAPARFTTPAEAVDRGIGAELTRQRDAVSARGARQHPHAAQLRELHRERPDGARGAVDDERFAGFEVQRIIDALATLAGLGFDAAIGGVANVWDVSPVEFIGSEIIPVVADF